MRFQRCEPLAPLDRELLAFGKNPAIGKPPVGKLLGRYRVTVGRVRAIAASASAASIEAVLTLEDDIIIIYMLFIRPPEGRL